MSLPAEHMEDFTKHSWCNALLSDPTITKRETRASLGLPESAYAYKAVSNSFFTQTLFTDGAVRAFCAMYRPGGSDIIEGDATGPDFTREVFASDGESQSNTSGKAKSTPQAATPTAEALLLISLGTLADGGIHRLHGGVTATLLDHTMGTLLSFYFVNTSATAELRIKYVKAVQTPCVLLCRARIESVQGRWIRTKGWLEDGAGTVFAEGEGAFVMSKGKL
jgi:hypothetical protein